MRHGNHRKFSTAAGLRPTALNQSASQSAESFKRLFCSMLVVLESQVSRHNRKSHNSWILKHDQDSGAIELVEDERPILKVLLAQREELIKVNFPEKKVGKSFPLTDQGEAQATVWIINRL